MIVDDKNLVCIRCGRPWPSCQNRCDCGGFCTWGEKKGCAPSSWVWVGNAFIPRPPKVRFTWWIGVFLYRLRYLSWRGRIETVDIDYVPRKRIRL